MKLKEVLLATGVAAAGIWLWKAITKGQPIAPPGPSGDVTVSLAIPGPFTSYGVVFATATVTNSMLDAVMINSVRFYRKIGEGQETYMGGQESAFTLASGKEVSPGLLIDLPGNPGERGYIKVEAAVAGFPVPPGAQQSFTLV